MNIYSDSLVSSPKLFPIKNLSYNVKIYIHIPAMTKQDLLTINNDTYSFDTFYFFVEADDLIWCILYYFV